jgi:TetR/AcrR family transcriptional regulator, transcriptional repressor for nem operon
MPKKSSLTRDPSLTRQKLIDASVGLILRQGFNATTIDDICSESGLTKGGFFHHFENKNTLGRAVIQWWSQMGTDLYKKAWQDSEEDPLKQIHRMFDIMISFTERPDAPCVCAIGMMSQELSLTHPDLRKDCARELGLWTENMARMLKAAQKKHAPVTSFDPIQVAWFLNSLWQGSMLISKTRQKPQMIRDNLHLAQSYVNALFRSP